MEKDLFGQELQRLQRTFLHATTTSVSEKRKELFHIINGDCFYPLRTWPESIQTMFWKKPLQDKETFKLMLFLVGNGCGPLVAAEWILSAMVWNKDILQKRTRQLKYINDNWDSRGSTWYYFDIHHHRYLHIQGDLKVFT